MNEIRWSLVVAILLLAILGIGYYAAVHTNLVEFELFTFEEFVQQMAGLFLVTLFVERAVEVLIAGSRSLKEAELRRVVRDAVATAFIDPPVNDPKVELARRDLADFRAETRRWAFIASVVLGLAAAAMGVRALGLFIDVAQFEGLRAGQRAGFSLFDIVLTSGLIAGGSDGLHQVVEMVVAFFKLQKDELKGRLPEPTP